MSLKTPLEVSNAIKKLPASDQVVIQTFIAKLKATVADLEEQLHLKEPYHHHPHDHHHDHTHGHDHAHTAGGAEKCCCASEPTEGVTIGAASEGVNIYDDDDNNDIKEQEFPPLYNNNKSDEDDPDMAATFKAAASDHKSNGDYQGALESYTQAILKAEPSALLYANRADCLLHLDRPRAAIRDCDEALRLNPDSAKALKIRGRAKKSLKDWKGARKDLSESQTIDFDDDAVEDLKFVTEKAKEVEMEEAKKRLEDTEQLKRSKKSPKVQPVHVEAQEKKTSASSAAAASSSSSSSTRGSSSSSAGVGVGSAAAAGVPAGMSGLLGSLMSDPDLAAGMKNPKILSAFSELMQSPGGAASLMSNPAKLEKLISDPEVGPFMQKLASKFGPMLGASMSGGMGGLGSMGGMGNHFSGGEEYSGDGDDVPDVPEL